MLYAKFYKYKTTQFVENPKRMLDEGCNLNSYR